MIKGSQACPSHAPLAARSHDGLVGPELAQASARDAPARGCDRLAVNLFVFFDMVQMFLYN